MVLKLYEGYAIARLCEAGGDGLGDEALDRRSLAVSATGSGDDCSLTGEDGNLAIARPVARGIHLRSRILMGGTAQDGFR